MSNAGFKTGEDKTGCNAANAKIPTAITIVVTIDKPEMTVNGQTVKLDSPAIIENNRTYLPVRAIANALGVANENIKWDGATSTATLLK